MTTDTLREQIAELVSKACSDTLDTVGVDPLTRRERLKEAVYGTADKILTLLPSQTTSLDEVVGEIDAAYEKATPKPWATDHDIGSPLPQNGCIRFKKPNDDRWWALGYIGGHSDEKGDQANAELICALVNNWPNIRTALADTGWRGEDAFQKRVAGWMMQCFTPEITADKLERNDRFIEEALELTQATGYCRERAHALVDYVFDREKGDPDQEVGGVMVTLAALCNPHGLDMVEAGERELARILQPEIVEKIRAKQASKPTGSALPVPPPLTREEG
jgi:hypothetical protein